jgi:hypothetical protein
MKIIDAKWSSKVNYLVIICSCGLEFLHRTDRFKVFCRNCDNEENIQILRSEYLNERGGKKMGKKSIRTELEEVLDIKYDSSDGEYQDYLIILIEGISGSVVKGKVEGGVSDDVWFGLSEQTRDWIEAGVDALEQKKDVSDFPDKEEVKEEKPSRRRRNVETKVEDKKESKLHVEIDDVEEGKFYGISFKDEEDKVKPIKSHRGEVLEITRRSIFLLDSDNEEHNIRKKDITCVLKAEKEPADVDTEDSSEGEEVQTIQVKDAIKGEKYLIDVDTGDKNVEVEVLECECVRVSSSRGVFEDEDGERYKLDLNDIITPMVDSNSGEEKEETEEEKDVKKEKEVKDVGKERVIKSTKVSPGSIFRKLICENLELSEEKISKIFLKEGVKLSEASISMIYRDTQAVISILKDLGKINE